MTLKELIEKFKEKNKDIILDIQEIKGIPQPRISDFIKKGFAIVYKTLSEGIAVRNAFVFVKNLDQPNEEAYWENAEPVLLMSFYYPLLWSFFVSYTYTWFWFNIFSYFK